MPLADLDKHALHLQVSAIEKSTVQGYATGVRDYIAFCVAHSLPLDPTPSTLSRYIAYTSKFIASGPKYLTGVRHFLIDLYPHFDASRSHPLVQSTIRGSKKVRADGVRRKLPLRLSHLEAFLEVAASSKSYDDLLFITILSCCFYACHRSGELIQKNSKSLFDWRKIIKRSSLTFPGHRAQYPVRPKCDTVTVNTAQAHSRSASHTHSRSPKCQAHSPPASTLHQPAHIQPIASILSST